jgi:hypothetical protein
VTVPQPQSFNPLLQAGFVRTGHPIGPDPYFLYAFLSYPVLLGPICRTGVLAIATPGCRVKKCWPADIDGSPVRPARADQLLPQRRRHRSGDVI